MMPSLYMEYLKFRDVDPAPRFNMQSVFPDIEIAIIKVRRSRDHLVFIIGTPLFDKSNVMLSAMLNMHSIKSLVTLSIDI